jgi:hypothetical protein
MWHIDHAVSTFGIFLSGNRGWNIVTVNEMLWSHLWNFALTLIIKLSENAEWVCCVFVNNYILENGECLWNYIRHKFDMCLEFVLLEVLCYVNFCCLLMSPYSWMHSNGSTLQNLLQIGRWTLLLVGTCIHVNVGTYTHRWTHDWNR